VPGIFAIMCPDCGAPVDQRPPVAMTADDVAGDNVDDVDYVDDVLVCAACARAFVVRFGHALALPGSADVGVA
jgi:hypothetical protein